ncbi:metal ABC transporter solute-binding protein, Zn/Mn family, partial [Streptomyces sp. NPDC094147]
MRTAISSHAQNRIRTAAGSTAVAVLLVALSACSTSSGTSGTKGAASPADGKGGSAPLHVVAAENFWGSVAQQLGGDHAQVKSIISNPDADPHAYEPTAV